MFLFGNTYTDVIQRGEQQIPSCANDDKRITRSINACIILGTYLRLTYNFKSTLRMKEGALTALDVIMLFKGVFSSICVTQK